MLAQIEALAGTVFYVPAVMVALFATAFVVAYKWMRAQIAAEMAEMKTQIKTLEGKVESLENGRARAVGELLFALEKLPRTPETAEGRGHLHGAIQVMSSSPVAQGK